MLPPEARRHQYQDIPDPIIPQNPVDVQQYPDEIPQEPLKPNPGFSYNDWARENSHRYALEFLPSMNQERKDNTERLKKLSKWSALADALGQVAQVTGASISRGSLAGDGIIPTDGSQTRGFLDRYRRRLEEDEQQEVATRQQQLQYEIRNMDLYDRERQQREQRDFQRQQQNSQQKFQSGQTAQQTAARREESQADREFRAGESRLDRASRERLEGSRARLQREIAELKNTTDPVAARERARRSNWMELQDTEGKPVTSLSEDQAVAIYSFVLEKMKESGDIDIAAYNQMYNLEKLDPNQMKRFITSHWNKYPEIQGFVNQVRSTQSTQSTPNNEDPLGLGITPVNNDPLQLGL